MSSVIGEFAVAIGGSLALSIVAKATIVSGAALFAARLARHSRASLRHVLFATAFVVLLGLPVVAVSVPARPLLVPMQSAQTGRITVASANIAMSGSTVANTAESRCFAARPAVSGQWALRCCGFAVCAKAASCGVRDRRLLTKSPRGRPFACAFNCWLTKMPSGR